MSDSLIIHTDGGARGNPGPAGIGVAVFTESDYINPLFQHSLYIGTATNNEAEYKAFLASLEWLIDYKKNHSATSVLWKLDSLLVVEQLLKHWKIKEPRLRQLAEQAWKNLEELKKTNCQITITHVRREYNSSADELVNQALDAVNC